MSPPLPTLPSASAHSELAGQAIASPGLVGPVHEVHVEAAVELTFVE
jgi:hypothetical protein